MDQSIRDLFPVVRSKTYLNTAAMAPMPQPCIDAVTAQLGDVAASGAAHFNDWAATKARVRKLIAWMLGDTAGTISFTRNTSDGLCAVASGLTWRRGDNIVSFAGEFPANYYPWRKVSDDHGVELRLCPELNGRIDIDELCSLIDAKTRLVALSAVQYHSGFRLDLERVGRVARRYDALFCVDIIQAFGAMPFDLPAQFVDVAAGSSYKWLCAPEGCGILYINDRARERVRPTSRGWTSVENAWDFTDREQPLVFDCRAWETGMGGSALFYGLERSLEILNKAGIGRIESHLNELTDGLCKSIDSTNYMVASSRLTGEKSQIVAIRPLNGHSYERVLKRLADNDVIVGRRGDYIRIAPHLFNNSGDIERFVAILP